MIRLAICLALALPAFPAAAAFPDRPVRFIVPTTPGGGDGRHSAWMPAWNVREGAPQTVGVVP
jgi:hypothetical protein